ncbi:anhydro-N-acetylmuramic acid kinase [Leifsonia sp. F6_8S_P_1B]|uniref:Anhydro-N-acetylmuramic acid kinase n=1 Tax=Leifsonia williamsii TaxID=3035919 RepID=A0ABT8K8C2_9MICO|nr:anhydro-N-acetylmuramic acid kinase [Leifsonia williamsii]MDN4613710.1 anhydro-N-acetylmuramic acid kinase [Leifsonia williamsii]
MRIVSLQSGTSVDGIDVAVVDVAPVDAPGASAERPTLSLRPLLARTVAWPAALRAELLAAVAGEPMTPESFCRLDALAGQEFARAAADAVEAVRGLPGGAADPDLVVSHGQTLHHWVESGHARGTLQIGQPAWIAERLGVPVLSDVRSADIAAGGEGAPLMGLFDRAWLAGEAAAARRPIATVNLGGIANVQVVAPGGTAVAFDSGPANGLIDAVVARATGGERTQDTDGRLAHAGRVREALLGALLTHPYFSAAPPKSTGRETFDLAVVDRALAASGLRPSTEDLIATLTALTARTVADAVLAVGPAPAMLIASGGGVHNPALMRALEAALAPHDTSVVTSDALGVPADHKESLLFALVGWLSWHGVPAELPGTPAGRARVLGRLTPAMGRPLAPSTGRALTGVSGLRVEAPQAEASRVETPAPVAATAEEAHA